MAETAEQIALNYTTMGASVDLVNEVVATGDKDDESLDCVRRNIAHLKLMREKDYWTTEDMTSVNQAIADGDTYLEG
jgi:hypothetical protein